MYNIIVRYIKNLTKENVNNFALSKGINLSTDELDFTYSFIKNNYETFLNNPKLLDLERYKNKYTKENFEKISKVFQEYFQKYSHYL